MSDDETESSYSFGSHSEVSLDSVDIAEYRTQSARKRSSVKSLIQKFESGSVFKTLFEEEDEYGANRKHSVVGNPGTINPIQANFSHLFPPNDRESLVSVNSILSGISETSCSSSSSYGTSPKQKEKFKYTDVQLSNVGTDHDKDKPPDDDNRRRHSSISSNEGSPSVTRTRQPPVIRRKSIGLNYKELKGDTIWTYGVDAKDLRLKPVGASETDSEGNRSSFQEDASRTDDDNSDETSDDNTDTESFNGNVNGDDDSTLHSNHTLIENDNLLGENTPHSNGKSGTREVDNISLRSVSSFEMVYLRRNAREPVSSGEFSVEVTSETVSAQNEFAKTPVLPKEPMKKMLKRQLRERVNELIRTEAVFVSKLKYVIDNYLVDLPPYLDAIKGDIFMNLEEIYEFHNDVFLPSLRDARYDLVQLAQCFRKIAENEQTFQVYSMYSSNKQKSNIQVVENKQYFEDKALQLNDRLGISSYLLEPVQRIPRYKLFLNDLTKAYDRYERECEETESLLSESSGGTNGTEQSEDESIECNDRVLEALHEAKSLVESLLTTIDCVIALENVGDCPFDILKQGKLLKQNEFYVLDPQRTKSYMRVFLCEKVLLFTTIHRRIDTDRYLYHDHIPTNLIGMTPKEHASTKMRVWFRKPTLKNYRLEATNTKIIDEWKNEISDLLWKQAKELKDTILRNGFQHRGSQISIDSQGSSDGSSGFISGKYNSLRGVPGEVKGEKQSQPAVRTTTWYCE